MDTYWSNSDIEIKDNKIICHKCITCGQCIEACPEDFLYMEDYTCDLDGEVEHMKYVSQRYDYVPCHHCTDRFSKPAPCQEVCPVDGCIKITRW